MKELFTATSQDRSIKSYVVGGGYVVEIIDDKSMREAWLYHVDYGIKSLMFGIDVNEQSNGEFLELVKDNLLDYIADYEYRYAS